MGGLALAPTRRTFVVCVHADGTTTVEDARSGGRRSVVGLDAVALEIGSWLAADGVAAAGELSG